LELRTGSQSSLDSQVSGAHSIEIVKPCKWLGRSWVMLTTGVRLKGNTGAQRELVAELAGNDVSALGFAEDVVFKGIPRALLEEAEELGFPVFSVPLDTGFREVISTVNRAILSSEVRTAQRLTSIQRHLLDALQDEDPPQAVIDRLAKVLDASMTMINPSEGTRQAAVAPPAEEIEHLVASTQSLPTETKLDDWHLFATPMDAVDGWLIAASRRRFVTPLTKPVMQSAVPILVATRQLQNASRDRENAARAALLEDLISPDAAADRAALRARIQMLGLDPETPGSVVVCCRVSAAEPPDLVDPHDFPQHLETRLRNSVPTLMTELSSDKVALLVQASIQDVRDLIEPILEEDPQLLVGIGRVAQDIATVRDSFRDALQATEQLRRAGPGGPRVLDFDTFDLGTILVTGASEEWIRPKLDETLEALRENQHLYDALVSYFEFEMDVAAAAEALFLHTNSLRYRLSRIESLLGESLKNPATIAKLYLALAADRELSRPELEAPRGRHSS
jgi:purine catabolism regulator